MSQFFVELYRKEQNKWVFAYDFDTDRLVIANEKYIELTIKYAENASCREFGSEVRIMLRDLEKNIKTLHIRQVIEK